MTLLKRGTRGELGGDRGGEALQDLAKRTVSLFAAVFGLTRCVHFLAGRFT